ncbi:hypothetical protein Plec18167_001434 [Paecilomyces lecythidis]|uniref:Uncharacterized protein n=1 Tax=Paecilomyces lecythidis TaxID=3004212 RepID=A0ABR3YCS5_9EURO
MSSRRRRFVVFSALACLASAIPLTGAEQDEGAALPNANHIFNAIHSSMRQWGSSLNHNGMSFFLATVPKGTQFYHGTSSSEPVNGTEWLAFEPEHALGFARPRGRGPPGRGGPRGPPPDRDAPQRPLEIMRDDNDTPKAGYLHTYATAKDLRLLYIDGMSAGKSSIGTLDSQDRILYNDSVEFSGREGQPGRGPGGPPGERDRAIQGCNMAKEVWNGRIDGILRMEAGFEIILCNFERDLEVVRITQAKGFEERAHGKSRTKPGQPHGPGMKAKAHGMGHNNWIKAIAARYQNIGGHRVIVDYDHFVTAYAYTLDLFPGGASLPRLKHLPAEDLEPLRQDLTDMIMKYDPPRHSFDWQSIADMIVTRYSDELQILAAGNFTTIESLREELENILAPFIDYSEHNAGDAITERCAGQFIPHDAPNDTLASQAVHTVSHEICSTLTTAMLNTTLDLKTAINSFQDLIGYLSWSTWKECRGCAYDELCVIPMWPMGTVEDYEHPRCKDPDAQPGPQGKSYWGGHFGHPPPPPGHGYDEL